MADPVQPPRRIKRRKVRPTHLVPRVGTFVFLGVLLCIWWWNKYGPDALRTVSSPADGPASVRYAEPRSRDVPLVRYVGSRSRGSPRENETGWDRLISPVHNKTAYSNLAVLGCVLIVLIALVRLLTLPNPQDKENRHAPGTRPEQGPRHDRA